MNVEKRKRLLQTCGLLAAALTLASLRNVPVLGIMPLAVGAIEGLIYVCLLTAVRVCGWKEAAVIGVITPIYLWLQRFADGYMVPVYILVNLTMAGCAHLALRSKANYAVKALAMAVPACAVLMLGGAVAVWIVKKEHLIRAFIVAWNMGLYSGVSILGASLICTAFTAKKARA